MLRILIEKQLDLDLVAAVNAAVEQYGDKVKAAGLAEQVLDFVFDRLRARYEDEGVDVAVYQSVRALKPSSPLDFDQRVQAVQAFRQLPEAEALAAANKRVSNILAKSEDEVPPNVDASLLVEAAEKALAAPWRTPRAKSRRWQRHATIAPRWPAWRPCASRWIRSSPM